MTPYMKGEWNPNPRMVFFQAGQVRAKGPCFPEWRDLGPNSWQQGREAANFERHTAIGYSIADTSQVGLSQVLITSEAQNLQRHQGWKAHMEGDSGPLRIPCGPVTWGQLDSTQSFYTL